MTDSNTPPPEAAGLDMGTLINIWHDSSAAAAGEGKLFLRIQTTANRGDVYAIFPLVKFYPQLPFTCKLVDIWAEETELAYPKSFIVELGLEHGRSLTTKIAKKLFDPTQIVGNVAGYMKQYILDPVNRSLNINVGFAIETAHRPLDPQLGIEMASISITVPPVSFIGTTDFYVWRGLGFAANQITPKTLRTSGGGDMTVYGFSNETLTPRRVTARESFDLGISTRSVYSSAKQIDAALKTFETGVVDDDDDDDDDEDEDEDDDDDEEEEFQDAEEDERATVSKKRPAPEESPPSPQPPPPKRKQTPTDGQGTAGTAGTTTTTTTTTTTKTTTATSAKPGVGRGTGSGRGGASRKPAAPPSGRGKTDRPTRATEEDEPEFVFITRSGLSIKRQVTFSRRSGYSGKDRLAEASDQLKVHLRELYANLNLKPDILRVGATDDDRLVFEWSQISSERLVFTLKYVSVEGGHPGDTDESSPYSNPLYLEEKMINLTLNPNLTDQYFSGPWPADVRDKTITPFPDKTAIVLREGSVNALLQNNSYVCLLAVIENKGLETKEAVIQNFSNIFSLCFYDNSNKPIVFKNRTKLHLSLQIY